MQGRPSTAGVEFQPPAAKRTERPSVTIIMTRIMIAMGHSESVALAGGRVWGRRADHLAGSFANGRYYYLTHGSKPPTCHLPRRGGGPGLQVPSPSRLPNFLKSPGPSRLSTDGATGSSESARKRSEIWSRPIVRLRVLFSPLY